MRRILVRVLRLTVLGGLVAALVGVTSAGAAQFGVGQKAAFFTGGSGTAGWVEGVDPLAPGSPAQVVQLSSPDGLSYGGFAMNAIDGLPVSAITALSYDFQVTTPGWSTGGVGSPRLVVEFQNSSGTYDGLVNLNPVTTLAPGVWQNMNAMTGAVDVMGGTCGYAYQASWSTASACFTGDTVMAAFVVNDSGWLSPLTVQVDNIDLNGTIYSHPATAKR